MEETSENHISHRPVPPSNPRCGSSSNGLYFYLAIETPSVLAGDAVKIYATDLYCTCCAACGAEDFSPGTEHETLERLLGSRTKDPIVWFSGEKPPDPRFVCSGYQRLKLGHVQAGAKEDDITYTLDTAVSNSTDRFIQQWHHIGYTMCLLHYYEIRQYIPISADHSDVVPNRVNTLHEYSTAMRVLL